MRAPALRVGGCRRREKAGSRPEDGNRGGILPQHPPVCALEGASPAGGSTVASGALLPSPLFSFHQATARVRPTSCPPKAFPAHGEGGAKRRMRSLFCHPERQRRISPPGAGAPYPDAAIDPAWRRRDPSSAPPPQDDSVGTRYDVRLRPQGRKHLRIGGATCGRLTKGGGRRPPLRRESLRAPHSKLKSQNSECELPLAGGHGTCYDTKEELSDGSKENPQA